MCHRRGGGEAGHVGYRGAGADVDEAALTQERARAAAVQRYLNGFRFGEPRFPHEQFRAAGLELGEVDVHQLVDHPAFAASDAGHVHAHRPGYRPQAARRVDERDGLGAVDNVLAGEAGHVRARAADHRAFNDDGFLPLSRERPGDDLASDATANDQILKVLDAHDGAPFHRQEGYAAARTRAFQDSPSDQSAMPSRARSLMRNCPGSADKAGKPPRLGSHTPGAVNQKLNVLRNIPTARALPMAEICRASGPAAMRIAMAS